MKTIKNSNTFQFKIEDIIMLLENIETNMGCTVRNGCAADSSNGCGLKF